MKIHIGNEIARMQKLRGISNEEVAAAIHTSVRNFHHIKSKEDISTAQLFTISELMNFNFFSLFEPTIVDPYSMANEKQPGYEKNEKKLTLQMEVKYPLSRASELGKFMTHVNSIGNKMGFELL